MHALISYLRRWPVVGAFVLFVSLVATAHGGNPAGNLRIELIAGYNFVVRSNIEAQPGTSPYSVYLGAKFCNDGSEPLTNVVAYIGNFDGGNNPTPGIYPMSNPADHPDLTGPLTGGAFALTHEGGLLGTSDAIRYLGTIQPGECVAVYWLVSYPLVDENGNATHGPSVKPDDDLSLLFNVWGDAYDQGTLYTADVERRVFMRNMLQAQANKIQPNTANKVPQEYLDLLEIYAPTWTNSLNDGSPGTAFLTEGYWYDLGNINQGFDNDGDLVPDYNAWMQPVGDPSKFDPSCFRLVGTRALVVIKRSSGQPDHVIIAEDELYFTNLPPDNTGGIGLVIYEFMPLRSGCTSQLTPYQAVASGRDNEKFNGDYGAFLGEGLFSTPSSVTLDKIVDLTIAAAADTLTYSISFTNTGIVAVGDPDQGMPLVVTDSIPDDTVYVLGSAAAGNTLPAGATGFTVFYSTNNRAAWVQTEPATASDVTDLQWWLSDALETNTFGEVTFQVVIDAPAPPLIYNLAGLSYGNTVPFAEDDATTFTTGLNLISGTVFEDTGVGVGGVGGNGVQDGDEPGIPDIVVRLYYDTNGNGVLDEDDVLYATLETDVNGDYVFNNLPDGNYIIVVDTQDPDLPVGYTPTSPTALAVTLSGSDSTGNDFGFAPGLTLEKTGPALVEKGGQAVYSIVVSNSLAATSETVQYTTWASNYVPAFENLQGNRPIFVNPQNALLAPDGVYATHGYGNADQRLGVGGFTIPSSSATITNVEVVVSFTGIVPDPADAFRANDGFYIQVYTNASVGTPVAEFGEYIFVDLFGGDGSGTATITNNITLSNSWDWVNFDPANSNLFVVIETDRQGGGRAGTLGVDAIGVIVTTDAQLGVLDSVPLYDYYDTNILQFASAMPGITSSDNDGPPPNTGRLFWENVGPLAPTQATNIMVTFDVIGPAGSAGTITTNSAAITNATYNSGARANEVFDEAETEIPPTGSIGDTIFWDANRSGSQDANEDGVPGVTVELYSNNVLVASTVTDSNGNYLFSQLPAGTYTVVVVKEGGPLEGTELTSDPDADGVPCWNPFAVGCDNQTTINLQSGQDFLGADFGYDPPGGTIGGLLWIDFNDNSQWDPGEEGLAFIPVELYDGDTLIASTLTDANGNYIFYGLSNSTYSVVVVTNDVDFPFPPGLVQTYDRDGFIDNIATNILVSGGSVVSVDGVGCTNCDLMNNFGYRYTGNNTLSGTVGLDNPLDIDGVLNGSNTSGVGADEVALEGVTVFAYLWHDLDGDGVVDSGETILVGTTITDANGDYVFNDLPDGFDTNPYYIISLAAPLNNIVLTTDETSFPNPSFLVVDNQNLQGSTVSAYQAVAIASNTTNVDFAFVSTLQYDFGDLPNSYSTLLPNGARHAVKETPDLYLGAGVSTEFNGQPSVGADADDFDDGVEVVGIWQNSVGGGTVQIEVGAGSGWLVAFVDFDQSGAFDQSNEMIISAAVSSTGGSASNGIYEFTFNVPGESLSTTNTTYLYSRFRLFPAKPLFPVLSYQGEASNGEVEDYRWAFNAISGTVYWDADADLIFSGGDLPQAGVIIRLLDADNNEVATTVTQLDGSYRFYGLPNGDYRIEMDVPDGANAILDADGSANGNNVIAVSLNNSSAVNQDFLLDDQPTVANISGTVWEDDGFGVAGNGLFDIDDMPVPGVLVSLYRDINSDGEVDPNEFIASAITDINGAYLFENLPDGNYIVFMTTPEGATSIDDVDGDANGTDLIQVSLLNGVDAIDRDFLIDGASAEASLSGLIWFDASRNGIRDGNETTRFAGVPVDLIDSDSNVVASTITAADGTYSFEGVTPGTYRVRFDLTDLIDDYDVAQPFQGNDTSRDSDVTSVSGVYAFTDPILLLASQEEEDVDLGLQTPAPTRAAVADVWGEWSGGAAEVVWETSSEYGTAAFKVYRVDPKSGDETPIGDEWIPSSFFTGGEPVYRVVDSAMSENDVAYYRLVELEVSGSHWDLGTHEVQFGAPRIQMQTASVSMSESVMALSESIAPPATSDCLKVYVRKAGMYAVTLDAIATGMDQSLSTVRTWAENGQLGMSSGGDAVSFLYDDELERIVFYGEGTSNFYAQDAVYWIRQEAGQKMTRRAPGTGSASAVAPVTLRLEENIYPKSFRNKLSKDWYYWSSLSMTADGSGGQVYNATLAGYAGGDVTLRVKAYGLWNGFGGEVLVDFNGTLVGSTVVSGLDPSVIEVRVPAELVDGVDQALRVRGRFPAGQGIGFFGLDYIELDYTRTLTPDAQAILFEPVGVDAMSAAALDQPLVLMVSDAKEPVRVADVSDELPGKQWAVAHGERYAVIEWAAIPELTPEAGTCTAWFMSKGNRIDYLVITSRAMEGTAQELADYRAGMGLRVGVALYEDICDLFADGLKTPEAIQSFLRYAHDQWRSAPWLILLAGSGHNDYIHGTQQEVNHLPPMLSSSPHGIFASDGLLTDLTGNGMPDLAIGRLPARNPSELLVMIQKIRDYENSYGESWHDRLVLLADRKDATGNDFEASSEILADAADGADVERIYLDYVTNAAGRTTLLNQFAEGSGFIHYTGHGNVREWVNRNFFANAHVANLTNTRYPVAIALTCLSGRFEDFFNRESLAEQLVRRNGGGAVAVWSASGMSYNHPATQLGEAFYRMLYQEGVGTLGSAILRAQQEMTESELSWFNSTFAMYNLMGDPALKLGGIVDSGSGHRKFEEWRWQNFNPADLANLGVSDREAVMGETGLNNFMTYAFGGKPGVGSSVFPPVERLGYEPGQQGRGRAELLEGEEAVVQYEDGYLVVHWNQRRNAQDVAYRLSYSLELKTWHADPPGLTILSTTPIPDSVMERIVAHIPLTEEKYFIRLDVLPE